MHYWNFSRKLIGLRRKRKQRKLNFFANFNFHTAKAVRIDDAFYEIMDGEFEGSLIHAWDVVN
jgi:hypothetical protein